MTPKPFTSVHSASKQVDQLIDAIDRESSRQPFQPITIIQLYRLLLESIERSRVEVDFTDVTFIYIGAVMHLCTNKLTHNSKDNKAVCMRLVQNMIQDISYLLRVKNTYQYFSDEDYELYGAMSDGFSLLFQLDNNNLEWQKEGERFRQVANYMQSQCNATSY